ncbi:MAG: lipoyl(octanoyl) transferase LipB [Candidatus Dormibacteraeota bacterium]|nr:lipoyl(octanoyl) transferase LipB [Candidatus Dormibacteraeota bacterium]
MTASSLEYLWLGNVEYADAWVLQRHLAAARARADIGDVVLLVEHPPVYTMGRNGSPAHVPSGPEHLRSLGADYLEVDRGGSVTFHGPGQLVAYPIIQIAGVFPLAAEPARGDVVAHLRALEEALIATVAAYHVVAARRPPYTGIWVGNEKLAAIGVKLASGVTTHGAALNVTTDLAWFDEVIPCGIEGAGVASLASLGVRPPPRLHDVAVRFATELAQVVGRQPRAAGEAVRSAVTEAAAVPA